MRVIRFRRCRRASARWVSHFGLQYRSLVPQTLPQTLQ